MNRRSFILALLSAPLAWVAAKVGLKPKTGAHWSDCAVHNEPAFRNGPCDCGAGAPLEPMAQYRRFSGWPA